jgi:ABC-type multidrug transport system ATPase subunit
MGKNKTASPDDLCYVQDLALQELTNATLLSWKNATRREDMRIGLFVLRAGQVVLYETTSASVLKLVDFKTRLTIRKIGTVRYSPQRFFGLMTTLYEQFVIGFDSDIVDAPTQPLKIDKYADRRFAIRTSRLFAPGKPLDDLSQGNISMPVKPPQSPPVAQPAAEPSQAPEAAPVTEPVSMPLGEPVEQPLAVSDAPVSSTGSPSMVEAPAQPGLHMQSRSLSETDSHTSLHNDSIYLIDLVIHLPTRTSKFLISRLLPVLRDDDTVESISIPEGGLFAMELDLDGVEETITPAMQITQQPAFKSVENLTKYRPLVLINDEQRVHIFQLERGLRSGSFNWTDEESPSLFYRVKNPDHYISAANMFVEAIPRFAGDFFAGSPMWLVVSLTSRSTGNSSIHFVALPEMQVGFDNDTRFDDPAQIAGTPGVRCARVVEYYDRILGACLPRMQVWNKLNATEPPNSMFVSRQLRGRRALKNSFPSVTRAVERFVTDVYLPQPLPSAVNIWPLEKPAHSAIFVLSDKTLEVFGLAPLPFTPFDIAFQKMSEFAFVGPVKDLVISPNGLHVFANVFRHRWELESMDRFVDICQKLDDPNTSDLDRQFLEPAFRKPCEGIYRRPNINDFVQYVGMCPVIGVQCYSFYRTLIAKVKPGYYTANAFEQLQCPPGSFCPGGVKQTCPPGFVCNNFGNIKPTKCAVVDGKYDESCYQDGLHEPVKCPEGASCIVPFLPPLPASPGYFISSNASRKVLPCSTGEYCLLGRGESQDRRCPGNFVCNATSVIVPELCQCSMSNCSYCPAGTSVEVPCPVGHYCRPSNMSFECQPPMFCPEGTAAAELCPAGFYCPTPSEKILCPSGYFCTIGSISPSRCSVFAVCNEGSKDHAANFIVLVVGGIVLIAVVVAWKVSGRIIQKRRDRTLAEAQDRVAEKRRKIASLSQASQTDDEASDSEDILHPSEDADTALLLQVSGPSNYVIDISFDHLGLVLPSGKAVLNGVTGEIRNSRVTAVMGPSGAGKTTFMTTLAGKAHYGKTVGDIFINGQKGKISKIKSLTGFVPQEDTMLRELTVRELLEFNASLRLPASTTAEERASRVETVLDVLGLSHLQYSIIGDETKRGISGGQRKRVNIGMELVAAPRILFLDEPTSGLDSTSSMEVCGMLRDVARREQIPIVTVIHQPRYDIFILFDDVLLLGPGGTTVYQGPSKLALSYFEMLGFKAPATANPADFFMDVISGSVPREGHPEFKREDLFILWKRYRSKFAAMTGTYIPGSEPSSLNSSLLEESDGEVFDAPSTAPESRHGSFRGSISQSGSIQLDEISDISRTESFSLPKTAKRKRTNVFLQFWLFFVRSLLQQTRNIPGVLADVVLVLLSAVTFGFVFFDSQYMGPPPAEVCDQMPVAGLRLRCSLPILDPFPHMSIMTAIGLALPAAMAALRVYVTSLTLGNVVYSSHLLFLPQIWARASRILERIFGWLQHFRLLYRKRLGSLPKFDRPSPSFFRSLCNLLEPQRFIRDDLAIIYACLVGRHRYRIRHQRTVAT